MKLMNEQGMVSLGSAVREHRDELESILSRRGKSLSYEVNALVNYLLKTKKLAAMLDEVHSSGVLPDRAGRQLGRSRPPPIPASVRSMLSGRPSGPVLETEVMPRSVNLHETVDQPIFEPQSDPRKDLPEPSRIATSAPLATTRSTFFSMNYRRVGDGTVRRERTKQEIMDDLRQAVINTGGTLS